jgi:hypothetical protein
MNTAAGSAAGISVTPQTAYISRRVIEAWLASYDNIERDSVYIMMRNGNSWKFGGRLK